MDLARDVASAVVVLALLGAAVWALRRAGAAVPRVFPLKRAGRSRRIETLERVALTPQHGLHLVRFGGREMMVATHPQGCSVLAEVAQVPDPRESSSPGLRESSSQGARA
jgi:flagellar biogenesis protein FliO